MVHRRHWLLAAALATGWAVDGVRADPTTRPVDPVVSPSMIGKTIEEVRVAGNAQVNSAVILRAIRTKEGDKFDPATVEADYKNIFALKRFNDVQAKVQQTATGVIVVFEVTEEKLVHAIRFVGNRAIENDDLTKAVDINAGEAIDPFRIALARRAIAAKYKDANYPSARVEYDDAELTRTGDLVFRITEGPPVTIRNIEYVGGHTFNPTDLGALKIGGLNGEIKTDAKPFGWWFFANGTYDPDQIDRDVGAIRRFYQGKGFFDVKVGRKLVVSPDQTEMQVDFVIEEGVRYKVGTVSFSGNNKLTADALRQKLALVTGKTFDAETIQRDVRSIVEAYSPLGFIYDPRSNDPNYLRIGKPTYPYVANTIVHREPGVVDLVYEISEGTPFEVGRVIVVGNTGTKEKVIVRELHTSPGELYNSGEIAKATERIRALPQYAQGPNSNGPTVQITPIGDEPGRRDVLVSVKEQENIHKIGLGGQLSSNYGLGANLEYTNPNFDVTAFPTRLDGLLSDRAFTGGGEIFQARFQPGFRFTNANVSFTEPYLFDQPYSFKAEAYVLQFNHAFQPWYERREGGSLTIGKQFDYKWSAAVTMQAEDVKIFDIENYYPYYSRRDVIDPVTRQPVVNGNGQIETDLRSPRAFDVLRLAGHSTVTDVGVTVDRNTVNRGALSYEGADIRGKYQYFGALGGEFHYHQFNVDADKFFALGTDALDRKTVLGLHFNSGYITNDAPFFNRFYGGGDRGSPYGIRGFAFRGVSPRDGRDLDPIGGDLALVGSAEVNFPIYGPNLRGVVFTDFGTIEPSYRIHEYRQSVGFGIRVSVPITPRPLAFDVAFPVTSGDHDIHQIFSFGIGF